jgi:hypothetical protein
MSAPETTLRRANGSSRSPNWTTSGSKSHARPRLSARTGVESLRSRASILDGALSRLIQRCLRYLGIEVDDALEISEQTEI